LHRDAFLQVGQLKSMAAMTARRFMASIVSVSPSFAPSKTVTYPFGVGFQTGAIMEQFLWVLLFAGWLTCIGCAGDVGAQRDGKGVRTIYGTCRK
jgi:hypothetical protein